MFTTYRQLWAKSIITIQQCSVENQKGAGIVQSQLAIAPFWLSMEHCWKVIAPFWFSANDIASPQVERI